MDRSKISGEGEHAIDIEGSVISMAREQCYDISEGEACEKMSTIPLIYRIKDHIHGESKIHYEPAMVSFGPYYHGAPAVQLMQRLKYECLHYIISLNHEKKLVDYLEAMKGLEQQVLRYYADDIKMGRNGFLKMLLLDGCFILVSMLGGREIVPPASGYGDSEMDFDIQKGVEICSKKQDRSLGDKFTIREAGEEALSMEDEVIIDIGSRQAEASRTFQNSICSDINQEKESSYHTRVWYSDFVSHDLLLLQNQIPFCVVREIYEVLVDGTSSTSVLYENITAFVENMIGFEKLTRHSDRPKKEFHHLLHLCHMCFRPNIVPSQTIGFHPFLHSLGKTIKFTKKFRYYGADGEPEKQQNCWRQATVYHQAGIEFRKKELFNCTGNPNSLLDVEFHDGTLEMPCLCTIGRNTECLFRNLIAFERSCPKYGNYFTAYAVFISQLISTPNDVQLLARKGIIEHQVNSDVEILSLFKALREDLAFDFHSDYYLKPLYHSLEAHYQRRTPKFTALLGSWFRHRKS